MPIPLTLLRFPEIHLETRDAHNLRGYITLHPNPNPRPLYLLNKRIAFFKISSGVSFCHDWQKWFFVFDVAKIGRVVKAIAGKFVRHQGHINVAAPFTYTLITIPVFFISLMKGSPLKKFLGG